MKNNKIITDFVLNIISTVFPLFILQLFTLPLIAEVLGGDKYGLIIVIISFITLISFPLGNVLNNTRLLKDEEYKISQVKGDFNPLLLFSTFLASFMIIISSYLIDDDLSLFSIILILIITVLSLLKDYIIVGFRLTLNYKKILISNLLLGFGYIIGTLLFLFTNSWQIIYLTGLLLNVVYIWKNTDFNKEPLVFTWKFKDTFSTVIILYLSSIMKNFTSYADKIMILPILGPYNVSIYYTAMILGKMISSIVNPLNSVLLSYLVKIKSFSKKGYFKVILSVMITATLGYFLTLSISPFFFKVFYAEWAKEALELVSITTAITVIKMMTSVINPFNLRFNDTKWQLYINGSHLLVYFPLTLILTYKEGLIGFCYGALIAAIFNFILQTLVLFLNSNFKKDSREG